jgi:hypothetical protein
VQEAGGEIHLLPTERHQLAHAEAVAVGQHEQRRVPVSVPATPARGRDEPPDLVRRQVLPVGLKYEGPRMARSPRRHLLLSEPHPR